MRCRHDPETNRRIRAVFRIDGKILHAPVVAYSDLCRALVRCENGELVSVDIHPGFLGLWHRSAQNEVAVEEATIPALKQAERDSRRARGASLPDRFNLKREDTASSTRAVEMIPAWSDADV